jgi:hypothetical protein
MDENLLQSAPDLGWWFSFQQDNDPKHAHSQDSVGVASGQVSECPWVAQPEPGLEPNQTSLERPENSCAAMLPIQPVRAWEDLQRRMCQACSVIPPLLQDGVAVQTCFVRLLVYFCIFSLFLYIYSGENKYLIHWRFCRFSYLQSM